MMAREALLDAIEALVAQLDAIIVVGAQAIYLHTGSADVAIAEFTTDGDLALDPDRPTDRVAIRVPAVEPHRAQGLRARDHPGELGLRLALRAGEHRPKRQAPALPRGFPCAWAGSVCLQDSVACYVPIGLHGSWHRCVKEGGLGHEAANGRAGRVVRVDDRGCVDGMLVVGGSFSRRGERQRT